MSGPYKVKSGVPIPSSKGVGGPCKYPWAQMGHGDSIWVPQSARRIGPTAYGWLKRHRPGWRYAARTEGEGARVWFIDPSQNGDGA
jgi:hypothetical protein